MPRHFLSVGYRIFSIFPAHTLLECVCVDKDTFCQWKNPEELRSRSPLLRPENHGMTVG